MEDRISFVVKNNRFPLSSMDKVTIGIILTIILGVGVIGFTYLDQILGKILVVIFAIVIGYAVYMGYLSSLAFKKIPTGLNQEQNRLLIVYCLGGLQIQFFKSESEPNAFVCFVHDQKSNERQEIFLISKSEYVLIHTNKEKESDAPPGAPDYVDLIGTTIFRHSNRYK